MRPSPSLLLVQELLFILSAALWHPQFLLGVVAPAAPTAAHPLSCNHCSTAPQLLHLQCSHIRCTAQNSTATWQCNPWVRQLRLIACHCSASIACHHCSAALLCHHCSAALLCHQLQRSPSLLPQQCRPSSATTAAQTLGCYYCSAAHWFDVYAHQHTGEYFLYQCE